MSQEIILVVDDDREIVRANCHQSRGGGVSGA